MQIGTIALFQRYGYDDSVTDSQVYREELALASQLEELGYDSHTGLWSIILRTTPFVPITPFIWAIWRPSPHGSSWRPAR